MQNLVSVDLLLDKVKYSQILNFKPCRETLKFINFIKLCNASSSSVEAHSFNDTPPVHYKMLDTLFNAKELSKQAGLSETNLKLANMVHRGVGKTTLFVEYLILYIAFNGGYLPNFGYVPFGVFVANSIDNGVKSTGRNIRSRYENSAFLQQAIPEAEILVDLWTFKNAEGKKTVFKGFGATTGVRGTKAQGARPAIAIIDDVISSEASKSNAELSKIEDAIYNEITFALDPTKSMILWLGTPFSQKDPLYKAVESGQWLSNVYPVCEKFPCEKEEFRGSWEDRFNFEYVNNIYQSMKAQGKIAAFNQEMMLRLSSQDNLMLDTEDFKSVASKEILVNKSSYNFYITTDFATSEKQSSDYTVISVWAYGQGGYWYLIDGICKKQTMDRTIQDLVTFVGKYKPLQTAIEVTGQQGGFVSLLQRELMQSNVYTWIKEIRPTNSKFVRFNEVMPLFKQKKIYFANDTNNFLFTELEAELRAITLEGFKSKHDDCIDTVSQLSQLNPVEPTVSGSLGSSDSVLSSLSYESSRYIV